MCGRRGRHPPFLFNGRRRTKAFGTINTGYNTWRRNYINEYNKKTAEWEKNYAEFLGEKASWVEEQYVYAANVGNAGLLEKAGADTEGVIARTMSSVLVGSMEGEDMETGAYVDTLLEGTKLGALMDYAGSIAERGRDAGMKVKTGSKRTNSALALAAAEKVIAESGEEMRKAAAKLAATQAEKLLMEAEKSFAERLANENEGMVKWEESLVRSNGYEVNGKVISREAVTDSTIAGAVRSRQTVHRYEDFRTGGPVLTVNLTNLEGVDADVIMMLIQQANREISAWGDKIFGRMDEATHSVKQLRIPRDMGQASAGEYAAVGDKTEDTAAYSKLLARKYEDGKLSAEEEAELERVMEGSAGIRDGELGAHIGFAPKFKEGESLDLEKSRKYNVEYAGAGEMGLIMLDFQWNAMMNSKGYTELAKPMYDQKMWEGEFLGMQPPTLRSITDIAVSIVAGIATAGMGSLLVMGIASAAAGLVDDLVLAGVDVTQGYKSAGEVGVELGKKVAIAAASVGVNAAFSGVGKIAETTTDAAGKVTQVAESGVILKSMSGSLGDSFGQVALNAGLAGAKTLATSTISSAVSGITYSDSEGFGYSTEAFTSSFKAGLVSSAVSMTSTFATGALGQIDLFDGLNHPIEEHTMFAYETRKFNNLIGGLAGQGVNYAFGGDFTLNLVNLGDFTNNKIDVGLLEIHLGLGEEIFRGFKLGSDGANVNFNTLKYALAGANNFSKVVGAKLSNLIGSGERLSVLNGINTMAYSKVKEERDFAAEMLGRDLKSVYEDLINKGLIEKDKAGSIVGNKDDNPKSMVTALAELMNEPPRPKGRGIL